MTIRVFASILALSAVLPACGGADPDPTPSTTAPAAASAATVSSAAPQATNTGRVYCPTCPIQCDPSDPSCTAGGHEIQ